MSRRMQAGVAAAAALLGFASSLLADGNIGGGIREEFRSNIRRTPDNERHELVSIPFLQLDYYSRGERFETVLFGRYAYRDYANDEFEDDGFLTSVSSINYLMLPKNLSWTLEHTHREVTRDAFDPDTPDNRQDIDFMAIGPNIDFRLTSLQKVALDLRYGQVRFSESSTDHKRLGGELNWFYQRSSRLTYNLNLDIASTEFDDEVENDNVDRGEAELGLRLETATNVIRLLGGYGVAQTEERDDVGSGLWLGSWTHSLSDAVDLNIATKRELTDATSAVQRASLTLGAENETVFEDSNRSDVFIDTVHSFEWTRRSIHGTDRIGGFFRKQNFRLSDRETTRWGVSGRYTHAFTPLLRSEYEVAYREADLPDIDRQDKTLSMRAELSYRPSLNLQLALEIGRESRRSTDESEEFTDWLGTLRVSYRIQQKRRSQR